MRNKMPNGHTFPDVFVFLLIGVFAMGSLMLVLVGAAGYRTTVTRTDTHTSERVLRAYVRNAVRADDAAGCIRVTREGDTDILAVYPLEDNGQYAKFIYVYEGTLREMYTRTDIPFEPHRGEIICAADGMKLSLDGRLLTVEITSSDGKNLVSRVAVRTDQH